jgi:transcriptional regulator with XRE-family HTH domain
MSVGQRIKHRRKELGISADKLGEIIGKNRATIFRYENGDIENMPLDVVEPIAKALLTTPQYLMGWDEEEKTAAISGNGTMSEAKQKLFALAENCSEEEAARLLQMMELFLGKR